MMKEKRPSMDNIKASTLNVNSKSEAIRNLESHTLLIEAEDILEHAAYVAKFVQGITLRTDSNGEIEMHSGEVTGMYYVLEDLIDRIKAGIEKVSHYRKASH